MLLSSWGFLRVNTAGDAGGHGTVQRTLQTEAVGLQLHGSKVSPCRLKGPWGQRSPLSLRGVCVCGTTLHGAGCQQQLAEPRGTVLAQKAGCSSAMT